MREELIEYCMLKMEFDRIKDRMDFLKSELIKDLEPGFNHMFSHEDWHLMAKWNVKPIEYKIEEVRKTYPNLDWARFEKPIRKWWSLHAGRYKKVNG